ncbi:SusD/RagB family nutrient-binding outer membrane lipoprotein [Chondrinema litorale]|uniref:SusD/RagB family nutrient-binding outer membrane lipoprotein n=1 Tax=Chondrinema litorale TaxID=2994555 RepID=UPI002543A52B|nr:SusD/RagB family nutrient-binding outer membrane lipoprotein [Chondrinema litorale]UZR93554.1 SusD/RagB family nutrient-binding outer membrane lipoprotein [Chondrinema litorale]
MKNIKLILLAFVALLSITACDEFGDDFDNVNPDVADNVDNNPELILTGLIREPINSMVGNAWSEGNLMAQYGARIVFTSFDQFEWGSQEGTWDRLYLTIRDARTLNEIATNIDNASYQAVSMIMEAWATQILTDLWGDVPYSEASFGKLDGNFTPTYDEQELIYTAILDSLSKANDLLNSTEVPVNGDIMFDGDLAKWQKFGNSLRLRVALRLSNVKPEVSEAVIAQVFNNQDVNPIISTNEDNAALTYLTSLPNVKPVTEAGGYRSGSFNEYRMSETLESVLVTYDDPRLQTWFNPTANSVEQGAPDWSGMKNGIVDGDAYTYKGGDAYLSKFADMFYFEPNAVQGLLMKYDEVQFILAEAALNGWIAGDAQAFYEEAITSSFEYWDTEIPTDYLTQDGVAYDGELETIITQKWISLLYTDYQGFLEFKRTSFPSVIVPGPDAFYSSYPSRFEYPTPERSLNASNYQEAVQRQGIDESRFVMAKVWWE